MMVTPPPCPFFIGQRLYDYSGVYKGPVKSIYYEPTDREYRGYIVEDPNQGNRWWWYASSAELRSGVASIGRPKDDSLVRIKRADSVSAETRDDADHWANGHWD